jgi:rod shape-determining protein MreC
VFALLSIALMVLDMRYRYLGPVRQVISVIVYPLQRVAAAPGNFVARAIDFFASRESVKSENARLTRENLRLAASIQVLEALKRENAQLRGLLQAKQRLQQTSVMAEVLYSARDPFSRKLVLDKGLDQDIQAGAAVVDADGVIGQVTRVYPFLAEVTLITDKDQAVPVQNLRSGLRAIVFGNGRAGTLDLRFMPINADIEVGDTLVTSGIDGTYPAGLPVARVSDIERDAAQAFARITCTPIGGVDKRGLALVLSARRDFPERPSEAAPVAKRAKSRQGGT